MSSLAIADKAFSYNFTQMSYYQIEFTKIPIWTLWKQTKQKIGKQIQKSNVFRYPERWLRTGCESFQCGEGKLSGKLSQPNAENPFLLSSSPFDISRKIGFVRFSFEGWSEIVDAMDFATGGVQAGGFYGAGMAGGRFDREENFSQRFSVKRKWISRISGF